MLLYLIIIIHIIPRPNPRVARNLLFPRGRSSDFVARHKRLPENISDVYACTVVRTTYSCGTVGDFHPAHITCTFCVPILIGSRTTIQRAKVRNIIGTKEIKAHYFPKIFNLSVPAKRGSGVSRRGLVNKKMPCTHDTHDTGLQCCGCRGCRQKKSFNYTDIK